MTPAAVIAIAVLLALVTPAILIASTGCAPTSLV
jgi:hypothetical protein